MDESLFLKISPGDAILYKTNQIGKILTFIGGSRDPEVPTIFHIANVDSGYTRSIRGDEVNYMGSEYRNTIKKPCYL